MKKIIKSHISEHIKLINNNYDDISDCIEMITKDIKRTLKNKKTIFFAGNGGSAADCEHLAGELVGRYKKNRKPVKCISLNSNNSIIEFGFIFCSSDVGIANNRSKTSQNSQVILALLGVLIIFLLLIVLQLGAFLMVVH